MYPNLGDTMKAMLRGKFRVLSAYIKRVENSHPTNLIAHMKAIEPKDTDSPQRSR